MPAVEDTAVAAPKPASRPKLSIVAANNATDKPGSADAQTNAKPKEEPPAPVKSVEALFAEAFAVDKLVAPTPLPQPGKDDAK